MKIVYLGSGDFGLPCLDALRNSKHTLEFIVTQPPRAAGRGRKTKKTAVAHWAEQNHIPFAESDNAAGTSIIEKVVNFEPDLIVVISFGQKICDELISLPPKGMINVHPSLLPKYRGAAPINWAVINGEKETGLTIATVTSKWDAGKIVAQQKTLIDNNETAKHLSDRLSILAGPMLVETIDKIEQGSAGYTEQDHSKATLAPKLKKTDGYITFDAPAQKVRDLIRGLWPWPGAAAMHVSKTPGKSRRVIFAMAELLTEDKIDEDLSAGTLDKNLNLICSPGAIRIAEIKPAGGPKMSFNAFVNGHRVGPYDKFVKIEK